MKKIVLIIIIIILLLAGALIAIPVFFKQNLLEITKATINNQINAKVEFTDFKLSLFKNFPKATIELEEIFVVGENEFKNDTLVDIEKVRATMRLASLFKKDGISIEEIALEAPILKLIVRESGKANWELTEETSKIEKIADKKDSATSFEFQLEKIDINNAGLIYEDDLAKTIIQLIGINFDISGKIYGNSTELITTGLVNDFTLDYNGINYISNTSLETKTRLDVNFKDMIISILENELMVNKLALELMGNIEIPADSMFVDLQLKTRESDFDNFLALVPAGYETYLDDIQTNGSASITGSVKGTYFEEDYPAFSLKLDIKDGDFQYAELPEQIKQIKADISIVKPQGNLNLTEIVVREAHAEVKNNPVDLTLIMNNLMKDPWFDGAFIGKVNFNHLKDVLPMDSVNIEGVIDANLFVKGNYSAIENEQYDLLQSDGIVLMDNIVYDSQELTQKVLVSKGQLDFSPESVNLSEFNLRVGQSDFNLTGKVSNYLNYVLKEGTLRGDIHLNSKLVNFNEILRLQKVEEEVSETKGDNVQDGTAKDNLEPEVLAFTIPGNIDISFHSRINQAVFDRLPISNIEGLITAKNGKLVLNGLNMNMLQGELSLDGSYQNTAVNKPMIDFGIDILNFDIPMAYQTLSGIQRMLPVAGNSQGRFSTNLKMKGQLSPNHKLIPASINGIGNFSTQSLEIMESPLFNQLRGILRPDKLRNVVINDFNANYNVDNGNLDLKPFKTNIAGQETVVKGTLSAENILNMRLDFNVQRDAFGTDIQNILAVIPGNKNLTMVPAGVIIKGPVGNPEVKMDLSDTRKAVADATKDDLKNSLNKLGKGLKKLFEK